MRGLIGVWLCCGCCAAAVAQTTATVAGAAGTTSGLLARGNFVQQPNGRWRATTGTLNRGSGGIGFFQDPRSSAPKVIGPPPVGRRPYNPELDKDGYPKPHIRLLGTPGE